MKIDYLRTASKISALPVLAKVAPPADRPVTQEEREGFLACQKLARRGAAEIASLIREGWTEKQAARLLNTYLRDSGVKAFFHEAFAWYGERTRFTGIRGYRQYQASDRVIRPGEIFILDVAPIYKGYVCDIGYTASLGPNEMLDKARAFLARLRSDIPRLFDGARTGEDIWNTIDDRLREAGYDNIHERYPFSVLGHRVHRVKGEALHVGFLNFGWQSYWSLLSRGLFGQLLNAHHNGGLMGLWAIEPHIGGMGFGAKFEEILVVPGYGKPAEWLDPSSFGLGEEG